MSAVPQSRVKSGDIPRLGIIAGGGEIPARLAQACEAQGRDIFIVAFEGQTDPHSYRQRRHMLTRLGAAGQIIETLKAHQIRDIVLVGAIRRPSLAELKPDLRAARFFTRIGLKALGDDNLLSALRAELEAEGFTVHGAHEFATDLLAPAGVVGRYKPRKEDRADILRGIEVLQALGRVDVGQAAIIQQGMVLGVEAIEGTDELIRRCKAYKRQGRGSVLVKLCKPDQDTDFDLPTIGPETLRLCADSGVSGIAFHAGRSLLIAPEETAHLADEHKLFVIGIDPETFEHDA